MLKFARINECYRLDFILEALAKSADGGFIVACPYYSEACSYHTGNLSASCNVARLKAILVCVGIASERIRLERISAVNMPGSVQATADFTEEIRRLGSSRLRKKGGKGG